MAKCELLVGGKRYGGWKDIEIQRGMEQLSGRYTLSVTDRWPGQYEPRPILPGMASQVLLDGEAVLTGYSDDTQPGYDDKNTWLTISGRDKTEDLVDCSAIHKTGQWKGKSLDSIAADLLKPFGIGLVIDPRAKAACSKKISSFNIEEGETVFACLERAARLQAVLMWTDGLGNVVLGYPGETRAEVALVEGKNIKYAQGSFSHAERFSHYIVKSHSRDDDDDDSESPSKTYQTKAEAADSVITRYRPLIVIAEDHAHQATAKERAQWEASVRAGRGNRATIKVQGWRQDGDTGPLWAPNIRVPVKSPRLRVDCDLLIVHVTYRENGQDGTIAELEVADPRSMDKISGVRSTALRSTAKGKNGMAIDSRSDRQKNSDKNDWSTL